MVTAKRCSSCGTVKPSCDFYHARANCKTCERARISAYTKAKAEDVKARKSAYRAANADKISAYRKRWAERNRASVAEYGTKYARDNKAARNATQAKRRARKLNATPGWESELTDFVTKEAADLAVRRERATGIAWHVDHMIPLQARTACGLHVWNNLQVMPAVLNKQKRNRMMLTEPCEWLKNVNYQAP